MKVSKEIAKKILASLSDRSGFDFDIDEETMEEIIDEIAGIIDAEVHSAVFGDRNGTG